MTSFEPDTSPLHRIATASWPLIHAFGVQVRVHWATVFVPLLIFGGVAPGRPLEEAALLTVFFCIATYLVIWTHEMGHVWAARAVGVQPKRITLHPLAALFHLEFSAPTPRAEFWIALAGPLTHAVWLVLAGAPYALFLHDRGDAAAAAGDLRAFMIEGFLWTNAAFLFLNLLPFWPMDVGRALRASMALRMQPNHASLLAAYTGFAGSVVLAICGVAVILEADPASILSALGGPLLVAIAVSNLFACRALLVASRWGDSPYARPEASLAALPHTTWNFEDATPAEPVHVEERRELRSAAQPRQQQQRRREPARPAARPLHERIDELLDRINEVGGVENLPEAERKELADASAKLRDTPPS